MTSARRNPPGDVFSERGTLRLIVVSVLLWPWIFVTSGLAHADVQFVWCGAVTDSSARFKAKVSTEGAVARVALSRLSDLSSPVFSHLDTGVAAENNRVVDMRLSGLSPETPYYYAVELDGVLDTLHSGRLRTFPSYGAAVFTIAMGSCASTGSNHAVFQTIKAHSPLMFLHMGDFHYQNIAINDPNLFRSAYETVLASPNQSALYRNAAVDYIWDDHDYGPNNSDSTAPGRTASRLTYQEYFPHYPLAAGAGDVPIYHSFSIGRVKFIVTDSRSARSPATAVDDAAKTMLGSTQKAWFKQELLAAEGTYPLKVWVNTLPWIGTTGDDGWHLYTNERREIAEFIKANGITGLCMVSGDAHMLAIDDGTNSDYATGSGAAFPVMHAAALDRTGSVKGGPYSHGAYPGGGQFGLMTVFDSGGSNIGIQWSGRTWENAERVGYTFAVSSDPLPCDCSGHADISGNDGILDILDVVGSVDHVFRGGVEPKRDLVCPHLNRGDLNCDAVNDILDVVGMVEIVFRSGGLACQPCDCPPYPAICP